MSGYTPLFDSVFHGSLCGRWPDIGIWALMLAMQDKNGEIDAHPSYIATVTGCPVEQVEAAITRFCAPDPASRTPDHDGRRLEPIPNRGFGWIVLNHRKYREKARLLSREVSRVESGANRERMAARRAQTPADPRRPTGTTADPPSDSDADADSNKEKKKILRPLGAASGGFEIEEIRKIYPKRSGSQPWGKAKRSLEARMREGTDLATLLAGTARYAAYMASTDKLGTQYVMQAATFFGPDRHYAEPWAAPPSKQQTKQDANVAASVAWLNGSSR
jgi:hypothetical protein